MSYAPGAPAEIWALVGVTDGAKLLAMWWWSKADHAVQRDPTTCTVWAPAVEGRTPAEALLDDAAGVHPDKASRTIRGYMAELKAAGLVSVEGRLVTLTPPALATPRQDPATRRRKSAGENRPTVGEYPPSYGEDLPDFGEISPSQLNPPVPPDPPSVPSSAPVPVAPPTPTGPIADHLAESGDTRAQCPSCERDTAHVSLDAGRRQCSACGGLWSVADSSPAEPPATAPQAPEPGPGPASPSPSKRRVRSDRKAPLRQEALAIDDAPRDTEGAVVEALLAEHDRLRRAALERHGDQVTGLPKAGTRGRTAMAKGCRQALRERGEPWCRDMLAWVGERWLADASQLAWSTTSVWTGPSCANAAKRMGGPARASPRRSASMLSAPPPGPAPAFTLDESDDQCLL